MKGVMAFITCIMFGRTLLPRREDVAAELEFDNPELSEWAVVLCHILEQAWIRRQSEKW
jgi:hypothetical protein